MQNESDKNQTVIEKNFFKVTLPDNKYEKMFHYGGLQNMVVVSNSEIILE